MTSALLAPICASAAPLLAQLFVRPIPLPSSMRLWMLLPLLLCVALVYRATRAHSLAELPRGTVLTFTNVLLGMVAIAVGAYVVHQIVLRMT